MTGRVLDVTLNNFILAFLIGEWMLHYQIHIRVRVTKKYSIVQYILYNDRLTRSVSRESALQVEGIVRNDRSSSKTGRRSVSLRSKNRLAPANDLSLMAKVDRCRNSTKSVSIRL